MSFFCLIFKKILLKKLIWNWDAATQSGVINSLNYHESGLKISYLENSKVKTQQLLSNFRWFLTIL